MVQRSGTGLPETGVHGVPTAMAANQNTAPVLFDRGLLRRRLHRARREPVIGRLGRWWSASGCRWWTTISSSWRVGAGRTRCWLRRTT